MTIGMLLTFGGWPMMASCVCISSKKFSNFNAFLTFFFSPAGYFRSAPWQHAWQFVNINILSVSDSAYDVVNNFYLFADDLNCLTAIRQKLCLTGVMLTVSICTYHNVKLSIMAATTSLLNFYLGLITCRSSSRLKILVSLYYNNPTAT